MPTEGWRSGCFLLLTVLLSLLFSSVAAQASVTGSLTTTFSFTPQTNSMEAAVTFVDLRSQLVLNVDVSGFRTQTDILAGFSGIDHIAFTATPTLGGVDVKSQLAFATPFAAVGVASFTHLVPVGPLLFVTERAQVSTRILGATLTNLAILEDVNFIHPFSTLPFSPPPLSFLPTYTPQSQSFRFGDIVTLQGQIISGPTLTISTGIDADSTLSKCVKGICFPGASLSSPQLFFVTENISLQNLAIGPVLLGATYDYHTTAVQPSTLTVNARFSLRSLGSVNASFISHFDDLVSLASVSLGTTAPPLTITTSFTPALTIASIAASVTLKVSPTSSVALQATFTPPTGLTSESASLLVSLPAGATFTAGISNSPSGPLLLTLTLNARLSAALSASAGLTVLPAPATTQGYLALTYQF